MTDIAEACGLVTAHIDFDSLERPLHVHIIEPVRQLKRDAAAAGFELAIASGFRSFERQQDIWNAKARGDRPVLNDAGDVRCMANLDDAEKMWAILRWSALPGASRHHFGTELDVYDAAAVPLGYVVQLTQAETENVGPFAAMHRWLDGYLAGTDFFRPYITPDFGVAPEPWHLSFAPLAREYQAHLELDALRNVIMKSDLLLKNCILAHLPEIYRRYVQVPWTLYPGRCDL